MDAVRGYLNKRCMRVTRIWDEIRKPCDAFTFLSIEICQHREFKTIKISFCRKSPPVHDFRQTGGYSSSCTEPERRSTSPQCLAGQQDHHLPQDRVVVVAADLLLGSGGQPGLGDSLGAWQAAWG